MNDDDSTGMQSRGWVNHFPHGGLGRRDRIRGTSPKQTSNVLFHSFPQGKDTRPGKVVLSANRSLRPTFPQPGFSSFEDVLVTAYDWKVRALGREFTVLEAQ